MGFIEENSEYIIQHQHSDPLWAKTISLATLAPFTENLYFNPEDKGGLQLNIYALRVALSGDNKTIPLKYVTSPLIRKAQEILQAPLKDEEAKARERILYPQSGSLEMLTEILAKSSSGIIVSNEFTTTIKASYGTGYMSDSMEFFSNAYDGTVTGRATIKRGELDVPKCHLSFLSTTTPFVYRALRNEDLFEQGTMNRFLLCVSSKMHMRKVEDGDLLGEYKDKQEYERTITSLAERLIALKKAFKKSEWRMYHMDRKDKVPIVREYINSLGEKAEKAGTKDPLSLEPSYYTRLKENFYKVEGLACISDAWERIPQTTVRELIITEAQQQKAVELCKLYEQGFRDFLTQWRLRRVKSREVYTNVAAVEFMRQKFIENGGRATLTQINHWSIFGYREIINEMLGSGEVKQLESKSTGGRTPTTFELVK